MLAPLPALAQSADTAKPATTGTGTETPTTNAITRKTTDTTKTGTSTTGTKTDTTPPQNAITGTGSTDTGTSTDSTGTSTTAGMSTNRNNGFDYSWLGLLSLAGLHRPAPTVISSDRANTTRHA